MKKISPCKLKTEMDELFPEDEADPLRIRQIADQGVLLIQDIIELVNKYSSNKAKFMQCVVDEIQVKRLMERKVIDLERHAALLQTHGITLSGTELELSCLIYHGFSTRVLRMIYNHHNSDSIYIRIHRISSKIHEQFDTDEDDAGQELTDL